MMNLSVRPMAFLLLATVLLGGCGTAFHGPSQFATSAEVFGAAQSTGVPSSGPRDSRIRIVYEAPFDDVFREAKVASARVQFLVEKADQDSGVILATRSRQVGRSVNTFIKPTPFSHGWVESEKRFYLIAVEELSGESTAVTIVNKVQFECRSDAGGSGGQEACVAMTRVSWPQDQKRDIASMEQFHNFLNNGLLAAGLL